MIGGFYKYCADEDEREKMKINDIHYKALVIKNEIEEIFLKHELTCDFVIPILATLLSGVIDQSSRSRFDNEEDREKFIDKSIDLLAEGMKEAKWRYHEKV